MRTSPGGLALDVAMVGEPLVWVVGPHRKRQSGRLWLCRGNESRACFGPGDLSSEAGTNVLACLGRANQPRRLRSSR